MGLFIDRILQAVRKMGTPVQSLYVVFRAFSDVSSRCLTPFHHLGIVISGLHFAAYVYTYLAMLLYSAPTPA